MHAPRMQSAPATAGAYPGRPGMRRGMPQQQPAPTRCMACNALSPHDARFCVRCGRSFAGEPVRPIRAASAPKPHVPPVAPAAPRRQPAHLRRHPMFWRSIGTAIFFLGLVFLAVTNLWWPGILVLLGMSSLVSSAGAGRRREAVSSAVFFLGMAFLAVTNLWWPGILVLLGIVTLLNALLHLRWRGW